MNVKEEKNYYLINIKIVTEVSPFTDDDSDRDSLDLDDLLREAEVRGCLLYF